MTYRYSENTFIGKHDTEIYYQSWVADKSKATIVFCHGIGEHSGRYLNIVNKMDGTRVSFFGLDHRGHGRSKGNKRHIESFIDYVDDVDILVDIAKKTENLFFFWVIVWAVQLHLGIVSLIRTN